MSTFQVAHFKEQGQNVIAVVVSDNFCDSSGLSDINRVQLNRMYVANYKCVQIEPGWLARLCRYGSLAAVDWSSLRPDNGTHFSRV
jgi:hypothetical protein